MAATKTVKLNISERVKALGILNEFKGALDKLSVILEDVKQFSITDEEWEQANRTVTPNGAGGETWTWDDEKAPEKELTLQPATVEYLRETIKAKNEKGEFSLADKAFITLSEKLA